MRGDGLQVDDRGEEGIIHIKHGYQESQETVKNCIINLIMNLGRGGKENIV